MAGAGVRTRRTAARARPRSRGRAALAGGVLAGGVLLAALAPYSWVLALLAELAFHAMVLALAAAGAALATRRSRAAVALLALTAMLAWGLVPLYRTPRPTPRRGPMLRVSTAHLAEAPVSEPMLRRRLERDRHDVLALTGVPPGTGLGSRVGSYRVFSGARSPSSVLLVQGALLATKRNGAEEHFPSAWVRAGRCEARVVAIGLPGLLDRAALGDRAHLLSELSRQPQASRSIWLGYLGSRANAYDVRGFLARNALRDGRVGHGRLPTGPSALGPLGFPLSHVLVHGWVGVREVATQAPVTEGAHRTLSATLELTEPRCGTDPTSAAE